MNNIQINISVLKKIKMVKDPAFTVSAIGDISNSNQLYLGI